MTPVHLLSLISEECVKLYDLILHCLHKLLSVTGAYSAGNNIFLDAYVKLYISSLDLLWFSHVIPTIIVPSLYADIVIEQPLVLSHLILSTIPLPFYQMNYLTLTYLISVWLL